MAVQKEDEGSFRSVAPGIEIKSLIHGARTHMVAFRLAAGADLPSHEHPHEQTGYLVSGCLDLAIDGNWQRIAPGDSWSIPAGVRHQARIIEDSLAIEVFSPVRTDYL